MKQVDRRPSKKLKQAMTYSPCDVKTFDDPSFQDTKTYHDSDLDLNLDEFPSFENVRFIGLNQIQNEQVADEVVDVQNIRRSENFKFIREEMIDIKTQKSIRFKTGDRGSTTRKASFKKK